MSIARGDGSGSCWLAAAACSSNIGADFPRSDLFLAEAVERTTFGAFARLGPVV